MTKVAASNDIQDVTTAASSSNAQTKPTNESNMANLKTEDSLGDLGSNTENALTDVQVEDGDSEAETLIQSPEKKKNIVDSAPNLRPTTSGGVRKSSEPGQSTSETSKSSKKRKRDGSAGGNPENSRGSSTSPLSSPNVPPQSRDSDSDVSDTPRSARTVRSRRSMMKAESEGVDGSSAAKARKRRPSDIVPPAKHRTRGSVSNIDAPLEHRETRSATYPRQSSEDERSSPRPSSRREHRRGVSTQLTSGDVERKKRGRPPNINTRRNKSVEMEDSSDDGDDSSSPPARSRTHPDSRIADHGSPAKPSGPRKWRDKNGRTWLSRACNNDDLEKARQYLGERPGDIDLPDNAGNTPLQIASLEGFTDIVRFLLESGAEVDSRNIDKDTPLIDAVENGHFEVIELLLTHGANPRLANAKGDEPYDLVPADDENYKEIRKLISDAKARDWNKRRKSSDNEDNRGSSRAASAVDPRDSPPVIGPRSPPGLANRRRTGRSESTRNDLLWQESNQENLRVLAAKGNVQGVATALNVLQKAEPAAVIAAAKAGHEEVLNYLLAMGDADPDPDPQPDFKPGYNTPMLAAIGRGNLDVVKLLVEQTGFNVTRKTKGRTYYEISAERKGESWQKEYEILKSAYEKSTSGKFKTRSPRAVRGPDRAREKRMRRSESPPSSTLRTPSSPATTHKSLPEKSPRSTRRDGKKVSPAPDNIRRSDLIKEDPNIAVASDQEQTVHDKRGHKHRRSQSDMPLPSNVEAESTQRRRRLVTGKEHRRSQSGAGTGHSDGSVSEVEVKRERQTPGLKRNRSSASPDPRGTDSGRLVVKKRRTVLESSPEEGRPAPSTKEAESLATLPDVEMEDGVGGSPPTTSSPKQSAQGPAMEEKSDGPQPTEEQAPLLVGRTTPVEDAAEETAASKTEASASTDANPAENHDETKELARQQEERAEQQKVEQEKAEKQAADARVAEEKRLADEKVALERALTEKAAAEKAEAERQANLRAAAEKAEVEKRAAEEAEAKRRLDEAEAKRKAEEDAAARKREHEEREEQRRRDLQRRQEEQIRMQHLEIERRRREALPAALSTAALLLENNDPRAKSHEWLSHFLPLYTVSTEQLQPSAAFAAAQEEWIPNFQAATLLATKDLHLRNYTLIERRSVTDEEKTRLWKVGRHMLSYDFATDSFNTSIKGAIRVEEEQRPKFMNMTELFWVKYSDFEDQVVRLEHLGGLHLRKQRITIRAPKPLATGANDTSGRPVAVQQQANGIYSGMVNGNGIYHQQPPIYANGGLYDR